jgi:hypothetical protein
MMTRAAFPKRLGIRPLKFSLRETPHATIETNRTCDIRCRSCYNLNRTHVKTLAEIKSEIDLARTERRLAMITLLGGEPTLHPEIAAIVAHVKSLGLVCQILTNGLTILHDEVGRFLRTLREAGIDRVIVHIDSGQGHVHDDIEAARHAVFSKLEASGILFSLSLTIYDGRQGEIPGLIRRYARYRHFDGILAVLARDNPPERLQHPEIEAEYEAIGRELGIQPAAYIPSNLDDGDVQWLVYLFVADADAGNAFSLSPLAYRLLLGAVRRLAGHYVLNVAIPPRWALLLILAACVAETGLHPFRLRSCLTVLRSALNGGVRLNYIVIQTPPEFDARRGEYKLCYHCPDATIRNRKLTPVCIADLINPLEGDARDARLDLSRTAFGHLARE